MKRIAVCLYGQFRTGAYCVPWIHETLKEFTHNNWIVDVFVSTKEHNFENNVPGATEYLTSNVKINKTLSILNPIETMIIRKSQDKGLIDSCRAFYAPGMLSLCNAVYLKQKKEQVDNFQYDVVLVTRLDTLLGPDTKCLYESVSQGQNPLTIYSYLGNGIRFPNESFRPATADIAFYGDSLSVDLLVDGLYTAWSTKRESSLYAHNTGPNTYIYSVLHDAGLWYHIAPFDIAIVRHNADLTFPVMESFSYHKQFWTQQHTQHE
jgi:hypothetical protein